MALVVVSSCTGAAPAAARSPHLLYMLECQGCHLADGTGSPGAVPSLRGELARFLQVPKGREFLVRVPGSAQSPLDDGELAAVLNWMLGQFGPAALVEAAAPFTAGEVGRYRRDPLVEVGPEREALLRRIEAVEARAEPPTPE